MEKLTRSELQLQVELAFSRRGAKIQQPEIISTGADGQWRIGEAIRFPRLAIASYRELANEVQAELSLLYTLLDAQ